MKYLFIAMGMVAIIVLVIVFSDRKKEMPCDTKTADHAEGTLVYTRENRLSRLNRNHGEPEIRMEMVAAEAIPEERELREITDSRVLGYVNNFVYGLGQTGVVACNAVQAAKTSGEVLYKAIIPAGAKLSDSKTVKGAFKGIFHGDNGIQGHADLLPVKAQQGTALAADVAASGMDVASLVVGQYYMAQINAQLGKISYGITKIMDFQDDEFRSRVFSLIAHVKKIADFQVEILENKELRMSEILRLNDLEGECTELLGQANLKLEGYSKEKLFNYKTYEKKLKDVQSWYEYQNILLDVLYRISDLMYTLHLGTASKEQCTALLPTYAKQVANTQERLAEWHRDSVKRLNIDIDKAKRKRDGFDGFVHFLPGLCKSDLNYRSISNETVAMIIKQSARQTARPDTSNLYAEDVRLFWKNGKTYYLPGNPAE